ncbi:MyoD family inhibitor [Pteropus alecto]|uniref:MyoD family inhibitor n=1 Tax=Pteropus alecto TaxID=9402 RepID=L5JN11_PTEAL|nr:MyoD family inhibitor [Pteropus alecto]
MLGVWIPAKELEKKRDSTDPLWGISTRGQGLGVLDAFDTPGQAPLLRILLGLFPKKPPHTPLHKAPLPRGRGPSAPSPVYSPPVFRLTSTEILNVLYTPGPVCVTRWGRGGIKAEGLLCSGELGAGGASRTVGAPAGALSVVRKSLHSPVFSQDHNLPQLLPRFEIQVPALVFSAGCRLPPGMRRSPASGHLCLGHHPGRHLPTCPGPITHVFVEATCIGVCTQTCVGRIELLGEEQYIIVSKPSTGRLRHSVLSAILQGKAETTAVVQLWNPAQPPTGPVPETGSQEELCMPAGRQTGWTPGAEAVPGLGESTPFPELPHSSLIAAGSRGARPGPRSRRPGPGSKTPSSRSGAPSLSCSHLGSSRGHGRERRGRRGGHGGPGHDGAARTFERSSEPMSQVSGQSPPHCDASHEAPSTAPGPAQTPSLLPGLEVGTRSTHPTEAALEEGSLEEVAPPMLQGNGPGAPQALDSTDLDVPTEAVTRQKEGKTLPIDLGTKKQNPAPFPGSAQGYQRAPGKERAHRKLQSHPSLASQGSKKSKGSTKSAASQIPLQAQEDCCVHCILSCLFCEFLTLCNIVLDCATCGSCSSEDSCLCCCCCGSGECADCDLPCDLDCGILDACCESADCLEICMECCGLCFSS